MQNRDTDGDQKRVNVDKNNQNCGKAYNRNDVAILRLFLNF